MEGADPGNPTPRGHSSRRSPRTVRLNSRGHACFPPCAWSLGSQRPPLADHLQAQLCALVARQGPPAGRSEEGEGVEEASTAFWELAGAPPLCSYSGQRGLCWPWGRLTSQNAWSCSLPGCRGCGSWPQLCPFLLPIAPVTQIWARRCKVGAVGLLRRVGLGT